MVKRKEDTRKELPIENMKKKTKINVNKRAVIFRQ